jgi:2'-5' RNA ligase
MPSEGSGDRQELTAFIRKKAKEHGSMAFVPHVTLVAALNEPRDILIPAVEALAFDLSPIPSGVLGTGRSELYFQYLYALVNTTPELLTARKAALHHLGLDQASAYENYMPHMSLFYGRAGKDVKDDISSAFQSQVGNDIQFSQLELWSTEGVVADWHCVEALPLRDTSPPVQYYV